MEPIGSLRDFLQGTTGSETLITLGSVAGVCEAMLEPLYLDTARLGQMSPRACRASVDFARLASEQGCSLYFSQFLSGGTSAWPDSLTRRYPELGEWQGIQAFSQRLKSIAGAAPSSDVVFAARSAELMRFAAHLLIGPCRNVLLTDLTWPAYERVFETEQRGSACRCTRLSLRHKILRERLSAEEVIEQIAHAYVVNNCDGLFLPLVDNLGVQLPIRRIVDRLRQEAVVRFVVVDGAQAIGHIPLNLADGYCDLLIAGCHKWLRAFSPLGLAFFGRPGSQSYIRDSLFRWVDAGRIDDPMLGFAREICDGTPKQYGETVQVGPLFTANAAIMDALEQGFPLNVVRNRAALNEVAESSGWRPIVPDDGLSSNILLFEQRNGQESCQSHEQLRYQFLVAGVALSTYQSGLIRVSLPHSIMHQSDLDRLELAFRRAAGAPRCDPSEANPVSYRPYFDDRCR